MVDQSYTPPEAVLEKYARLLVHFGMQTRDGKKLKKGSVVCFEVPVVAYPMYRHLQNEILKAGYQPIGEVLPSDFKAAPVSADFFQYASKKQRTFVATSLNNAKLETIDGRIRILADALVSPLATVAPTLVSEKRQTLADYRKKFFQKYDDGKLAWTLGLYATDAIAAEAQMTLKAYWNQIIKACYLDKPDPVAEWYQISKIVQGTAKKLSKLKIDSIHMVGPDANITIGIGANRAWLAGGGCNIPSYEVFTSPDYRRVNGWIRFSQPLYNQFGTLIKGIELTFKDGICTHATAKEGEASLQSILKTPGANRLGEFSLTDARLSRITHFMAETLYDENVGGKYGNTHVAIGSAYRDCFQGKESPQTDAEWDALGYNDSIVHEDIVSTTNRTVTATLHNGKEVVIYKNGQFTL